MAADSRVVEIRNLPVWFCDGRYRCKPNAGPSHHGWPERRVPVARSVVWGRDRFLFAWKAPFGGAYQDIVAPGYIRVNPAFPPAWRRLQIRSLWVQSRIARERCSAASRHAWVDAWAWALKSGTTLLAWEVNSRVGNCRMLIKFAMGKSLHFRKSAWCALIATNEGVWGGLKDALAFRGAGGIFEPVFEPKLFWVKY